MWGNLPDEIKLRICYFLAGDYMPYIGYKVLGVPGMADFTAITTSALEYDSLAEELEGFYEPLTVRLLPMRGCFAHVLEDKVDRVTRKLTLPFDTINKAAQFDNAVRRERLDGEDRAHWLIAIRTRFPANEPFLVDAYVSSYDGLLAVPDYETLMPKKVFCDVADACHTWCRNMTDYKGVMGWTIQMRLRNNIALKAMIIQWMLDGKLVRGQQVDAETVIHRQQVLWSSLFDAVFYFLGSFVGAVFSAVDALFGLVINVDNVYAAAVRDILILYVVLHLLLTIPKICCSLWKNRYPDFTIKQSCNPKLTVYIRKRITANGIFHDAVVDGAEREIPEDYECKVTTEEMAMPNSDLYASSKRPLGVILVATEHTELHVLGCFFRYEDYLVTAGHIANNISSSAANVYLASFVEIKNSGTWRVDKRCQKIENDVFDLDNNLYCHDADVFVTSLNPRVWAKVGVTKVKVKASRYKLLVNAVGVQNEIMMSSSGSTKPGSGVVELHHTASTRKGFSGSPLFSGQAVIGLHVAGANDHNVAIRIENVLDGIKVVSESNMPEDFSHVVDYKFKGRTAHFESYGDEYVAYSDDGAVYYGVSSDYYEKSKSKYQQFLDDEDEVEPQTHRRDRRYDNENATIVFGTVTADLSNYVELPREKPVHGAKSPSPQPEVVAYLSDKEKELEKLGYDKEKYQYPVITKESQSVSLTKHLDLFGERVRSISTQLSESERNAVKHAVLHLVAANRYEAPIGYRTKENLVAIINSSLVKDSKSPGYPYQADGMPLNSAVLARYGVEGFADVALQCWGNEYQNRVMIKGEPTKRAKLDAGMARIIAAQPLHKMVKDQAIFRNMQVNAVENWKESPIKYAFNPSTPGHIEHLGSVFKGYAVFESDKTNWDYMFSQEAFELCRDIIMELPVQPAGMSDEEFDQYRVDVKNAIDEVIYDGVYRCDDGRCFKSKFPGIMKSGWVLTIWVNSLAQIVVDTMIKVRMGLTKEQICSKPYTIIAGGDDVLQTFPDGFNTMEYIRVGGTFGFVLTEFEIHESLDGAEFFSNTLFKRAGIWQYVPVRFTKHIAHLATVKVEDLAGCLASHMSNYCWDHDHFRFFERMFMNMRENYPDMFPLKLLKSQRYLQFKSKGCELGLDE
jgi:hypothetical protein